mgnify:CR=1 FL=1
MVTIEISESGIGPSIPSFRSIGDKHSLNHNSGALLMSMLEYPSNSPEYKLASIALQNNLLRNLPDDAKTFTCPHPDWFDKDSEEVKVDATICRFCGIKSQCKIGRPKKRIQLVINGYKNEKIPPQEELEKCFEITDSSGNKSKIDPFIGFSLEAKLSRNLYSVSKSTFEKLFLKSNQNYYHSTAMQYSIGFELHSGTPLWPIDQRLMQNRFEMKIEFSKALRNSENYQYSHSITNSEFAFVVKIALDIGWIKESEKEMYPALRHLFSDLSYLLKQIKLPTKNKISSRGIEKLSKSSMKPLVDIPYSANNSGMIILALRWAQLCPKDIKYYMDNCDINHQTYSHKSIIVDRITHSINDLDKLEEIKINFLPRLPIIVLTKEEHIPLLVLNSGSARIIDLIIADVPEPFYLIDSLGYNLFKDVG